MDIVFMLFEIKLELFWKKYYLNDNNHDDQDNCNATSKTNEQISDRRLMGRSCVKIRNEKTENWDWRECLKLWNQIYVIIDTNAYMSGLTDGINETVYIKTFKKISFKFHFNEIGIW